MSPVIPFSVSNYLCGLSGMAFPPFLLGTALGNIPWAVLYVSLGATGHELLMTGGMRPLCIAVRDECDLWSLVNAPEILPNQLHPQISGGVLSSGKQSQQLQVQTEANRSGSYADIHCVVCFFPLCYFLSPIASQYLLCMPTPLSLHSLCTLLLVTAQGISRISWLWLWTRHPWYWVSAGSSLEQQC